MKILSWNVNGVQARLDAMNRLVAEFQPDMSEALLPCLTKSEILTDITDTTNSPLLVEINLPQYL